MSVKELLSPNNYNLMGNSLTVNTLLSNSLSLQTVNTNLIYSLSNISNSEVYVVATGNTYTPSVNQVCNNFIVYQSYTPTGRTTFNMPTATDLNTYFTNNGIPTTQNIKFTILMFLNAQNNTTNPSDFNLINLGTGTINGDTNLSTTIYLQGSYSVTPVTPGTSPTMFSKRTITIVYSRNNNVWSVYTFDR